MLPENGHIAALLNYNRERVAGIPLVEVPARVAVFHTPGGVEVYLANGPLISTLVLKGVDH